MRIRHPDARLLPVCAHGVLRCPPLRPSPPLACAVFSAPRRCGVHASRLRRDPRCIRKPSANLCVSFLRQHSPSPSTTSRCSARARTSKADAEPLLVFQAYMLSSSGKPAKTKKQPEPAGSGKKSKKVVEQAPPPVDNGPNEKARQRKVCTHSPVVPLAWSPCSSRARTLGRSHSVSADQVRRCVSVCW